MLVVTADRVRAQAGPEVRAGEILDRVSKKYQSYQTLKADFSYTLSDPQAGVEETQNGTLYTTTGDDKYKVELPGQELYSDGKTAWVYLEEVNEVQVSTVETGPETISPSRLFTLHEQGFKHLLKDEGVIGGEGVWLIDLVPEDERPYSKIELAVGKSAYLIREMKIFDKNGSHYTYRIKTTTPGPRAATGFFTFDPAKHPGVEVVDLR